MLSRRSFIKLLMPKTFSAVLHCHYTCFYKQMGNIFWCFKVIWLMHYSFIQIGKIQTNSQLELPKLIFPSTNTKLFFQGLGWCTGFIIPAFNILSISCLNGSLEMSWHWLSRVCLGVTLGSTCIWHGGPGKHPIPSNKHLDKLVESAHCLLYAWVLYLID